MAVNRPIWLQRIHDEWTKSPIVWLAGVRRVGKSTLCDEITGATYVNCDLPSVARELENPEHFFSQLKGQRVIFDEIHQLPEASKILKIGADVYKKLKILATGSSTLVASKKFKDALTGRKRQVHMLPVLVDELESFGTNDLKQRILRGGMPQRLLANAPDPGFYAEWLDSFYARDIQELFAVDKRQAFLKLLEYMLLLNGQQLDVTAVAKHSGLSRPSAIKYLDVLELTKAITLLRPYSKNSLQEIVSQPKVYAFDTGFCVFARGITEFRAEDGGLYLENLCLETMQSLPFLPKLFYWRTKQQHEMDFVLSISEKETWAIEVKWQEKAFNARSFVAFRKFYPKGRNIVVTGDTQGMHQNKHAGMNVEFVNIRDFRKKLISSLG